MKIEVKWRRVQVKGVVVPISVIAVAVETEKAVWDESFANGPELSAFIRGVRAAASMYGSFDVEIIEVKDDDEEAPLPSRHG